MPWGLGGRSCVGKKVAELELSLLLMEMLSAFEWTVDQDVELVLRLISVPSKNFKIILKEIAWEINIFPHFLSQSKIIWIKFEISQILNV